MRSPDQFSDREKAVIDLLLQGKSNKQIALSLGITSRTVEFHVSNIYKKLGVSSRAEALIRLSESHPREGETARYRVSTVENPQETAENDGNPMISTRRITMKKISPYLILITVIGCVSLLAFLLVYNISVPNKPGRNGNPAQSLGTPQEAGVPTMPALVEEPAPTLAQTADTGEARLSLNWFYVDPQRAHLEMTICGLPAPEDARPIHVVDAEKIAIYRANGSPLELAQQATFEGGGGGGEGQPEPETAPCFRETFDYLLKEVQSPLSQEDTYTLEIPAGGSVVTENGEVRSLPPTTFRLQQKPTYRRLLTFVTHKTARIEDKTVTFQGLELNPNAAAVLLCVLDPQGKQWLPAVSLIYQGNVIDDFSSGGVTGDSSGGAGREICYRLNYAYPFHLDATSDPKMDLSVLLTKLTADQPERLPYDLIARAQNKLAGEGIEFHYVVISHGADIVVTRKPENLTEGEALRRVNLALSQDAVPSDLVIFNLE
jgi:DNA-binding CsgD family transcriptional regulator